jgi:MerR family mercuric resistance operon transcriptional regulator
MKDSLRIGEVSKRSGIGVETVRFYEREGLIADPPRGISGYRAYPADVVPRLAFIRHAKELGFTLREIRELLSLRVDPKASCSSVKKCANIKLSDIEERIRSLQRMRRTLRTLVKACDERKPTNECPILGALDRRKR